MQVSRFIGWLRSQPLDTADHEKALRVLDHLIRMTFAYKEQAEEFQVALGCFYRSHDALPALRTAALAYRNATTDVCTPVLESNTLWPQFRNRRSSKLIGRLRRKWTLLHENQLAYLNTIIQLDSLADVAKSVRQIQEHEMVIDEVKETQRLLRDHFQISDQEMQAILGAVERGE